MNWEVDACDDDHEPRWLIVNGAPLLDGASATVIVELLWALADTIDGEYAAEIEGHHRRARWQSPAWSPSVEERQLSLDLGDADDF